MKVIEPHVEYITPFNELAVLQRIENCGRICYKSEGKIDPNGNTAAPFVKALINRGHEAVLEHATFTVKFVTDRAVANEIVRHRIAAYCQESTRYCNYSNEQFGEEITVVRPCNIMLHTPEYNIWLRQMKQAEVAYFDLLDCTGITPQVARSVLPNCLKTELICTMNMREWRHFFRLRCAKTAHPDCRRVALQCLHKFADKMPVLFEDLYEEFKED